MQELGILDAPTASPFTMESVGGNHGETVSAASGVAGNDMPGFGGDEVLDESDEAERGEAMSMNSGKGEDIGGNGEGTSRRRSSFRNTEQIELETVNK